MLMTLGSHTQEMKRKTCRAIALSGQTTFSKLAKTSPKVGQKTEREGERETETAHELSD